MKMMALLILVMSVYAGADPEEAKFDLQWKPKCSDVKLDDWVKSFNSCYQVTGSQESCKCVADGIIQGATCEEFKSLEQNKSEQSKLTRRLASLCKNKKK